jgi:hypothetical protein
MRMKYFYIFVLTVVLAIQGLAQNPTFSPGIIHDFQISTGY